jgi:hypothetical protein
MGRGVERFKTVRDAKNFLAGKIIEEAQREGAPLTEVERKMPYFTETGWTLPDMKEVSADFDRGYDQGECAQKIGGLAARLQARLDVQGEQGRETWDRAIENPILRNQAEPPLNFQLWLGHHLPRRSRIFLMKIHSAFSLRGNRRINLVVACVAALYGCLLARPGFLFANVVTSGPLAIYSHQPTEGLLRDTQVAEALLAAAPLPQPSATHRLYLTESYREYRLFSPAAADAFGITYPLIDSSFLAVSDPVHDLILRDGKTFNRRPLSAVIAHESSHTVLAKHFGELRMLFVPSWKAEGYCDYVAGGHSVGDDAAGLRLLAGGTIPAASLEYFRGYLRMKYLLEGQRMTVDQIFAQHFETQPLDREATAWLTAQRAADHSAH